MSFVLTLLGTDTTYTPRKPPSNALGESSYDFVESLSYISSLIQGDSANYILDDVIHYRNSNITVIDGPTTLGIEVGDRIARGVASILEALSRGETEISILAHSRGAVEAILVAHELERIQKLFLDGQLTFEDGKLNETEIKKITESKKCTYTKKAMQGAHKQTYENLDYKKISGHIGNIKLSILNHDPVPGGNFLGVTRATTIAWRDERFYHLPANGMIKKYEQIICKHERTRCFKGILPKSNDSVGKYIVKDIHGHHGLFMGNLKDQQRQKGIAVETTKAAQVLTILNAIEHLNADGVKLTPRPQDDDPLPEIREIFVKNNDDSDYTIDLKKLRQLKLKAHNEIKQNEKVFEQFNETSYATLGQEQSFLKRLGRDKKDRIVHKHGHNDTFLSEIISPVPGNYFLNYEHVHLYIEETLGLNGDEPLDVLLTKSVEQLKKVCEHTYNQANITNPDELSQSTLNDPLAKPLLTQEGLKTFLAALSVITDDVSQHYLHNTATHKKIETAFEQFKTFTEENPNYTLATQILAFFEIKKETTFANNLKRLEEKCSSFNQILKNRGIKNLQESLTQNFKASHYKNAIELIDELNSKKDIKEIRACLQEKIETIESSLADINKQLKEAEEIKPLEEAEKTNLIEKANALIEEGTFLNEALEETFNYEIEKVMQEASDLYIELDDFSKKISSIENLENIPIWQEKLQAQKDLILHLAAEFIIKEKQSLETTIAKAEQLKEAEKNVYYQVDKLVTSQINPVNPPQLDPTQEEIVVEEENPIPQQPLEQSIEKLKTQLTKLNTQLMKEQLCQQLIDEKLLSLTENYLLHLAQEVDCVENKSIAQVIQRLKDNNDYSDEKIKDKIAIVIELYEALTSQSTASEKVSLFYSKLNTAEVKLKEHRDPAWQRFAAAAVIAVGVVLSGVLPGLAALAIFVATTDKPKIWQSHGHGFFSQAKKVEPLQKEPEDNLKNNI